MGIPPQWRTLALKTARCRASRVMLAGFGGGARLHAEHGQFAALRLDFALVRF
ncbi:hypothetical protein [Flavisphingopyxis soli]|uniref:hypothetical protein n=1 Tax=Flavisphingopyxis soli TaxID=2601267 RepID=UPI00137617C8|nr:hypothetical protein [Sphingorhabdus soli]